MMTGGIDLFGPSGLRLMLALTMFIPVLFVIFIVMIFFSKDFILLVFLALVISYSVGCLIDHFIKSRTIKIVIASVAALVSIVLGYLFIRSMNPTNGPIVCDPVHVPSDCELACRDAIGNTTGTTSIVAQKLDECLQNCYR